MSVTICNYLVRSSPQTFTDNTPNPGVIDRHGAQYVRLVDEDGNPVGSTGSRGGSVQTVALAADLTTNTTAAAVAGMAGVKTFWGQVDGTGAVSVTLEVFGAQTSSSTVTESELLCTLTPTGTTHAHDVAAGSQAAYPYYIVRSTLISGTGATAKVEVNY